MKGSKIKTVIIGLGWITQGYEADAAGLFGMKFATHFSALRNHRRFTLSAAQDISTESRSRFKKGADECEMEIFIYSDWREMVEREKPELVVVATNTESHAEICGGLIDMGVKNILCEKPISYSVTEAESLVRKAEKKGCKLFINYFRAFNPSYIKLVENIKKDFLGKVQGFGVKYTKGVFNNGTHFFDLLVRMFGEIKSVKGLKNFATKVSEKDPTLSAAIEFKNGVSGFLHGMDNNFYNILELDILGELGRIRIVNEKAEFYLPKKSKSVKWYRALNLVPEKRLTNIKDGLRPVYDNIYSCLRLNGRNRCSGRDSLNSLRIAGEIVRPVRKHEK